jgi:hypothetical protein
MTRLIVVIYALMSGWLIIAAGRRIALELSHGATLDWSPFVSGTIGILAILALVTAWDELRDKSNQ